MSFGKITTCLWSDTEAEAAAKHYTAIFPNSSITHIQRYTESGYDLHHKPAGTVLMVSFILDGHPFTALNGGPSFQHTEAISFQIECQNQAEVDYYWVKLGEDGNPDKQACGWIADKFGVSWQVVPKLLTDLMNEGQKKGEENRVARLTDAMMRMKKMDIEALKKAYDGREVSGADLH